ncbi:hypothetical protein [Streptomyces sp. NPDC057616]|uniref:hypothetical protein n=1 Tax=Streptomyces sp. NPDC057616 TaxID=3346183 RepID=UPI0036AA1767
MAVQDAEEDRRRLRWLQAAPAGLRDAKVQLATLVNDGCPDSIERIRALLTWAGVPARESTGGLKRYDMAVELLLLAEDPDLAIAALATGTPSPGHLDGAAQLFSSFEWTTAHGRDLAEPLRSMLIAHIPADGTAPMRLRMRHGYYGAERFA